VAISNGISKALKASGKVEKVGTKTGAVVGGVTVAAAGAGLGGAVAAGASGLIDKISDMAKYIPYIITGICAFITLALILRRKRK